MKHLILMLAITSVFAIPIRASTSTYDITFADADPSVIFGFFTYDGSVFTDFTVEFDGTALDFTAAANAPDANGCYSGLSSPQLSFALMTLALAPCNNSTINYHVTVDSTTALEGLTFGGRFGPTVDVVSIFGSYPGAPTSGPEIREDFGTWTITVQTNTPEPATFATMLCLTLVITGMKLVRWSAHAIETVLRSS
jgi:hypothetical protein